MKPLSPSRNGLSIGSISIDAGRLSADEARAFGERLRMAVAGLDVPSLTRPVHIDALSVRLPQSKRLATPSIRADAVRHALNDAIRNHLATKGRLS
ncbi:hypothetical protein [Hoeflea ulvae]|uniref:Uncharacterized protein n=1 Tax=Hoeflea ulvae TaxID=2983764 RepID=A0ABT3YL84_9HYPH|nr:hypothetical protein [Hoeflea ulvae]MCY0096582.1 hypothetical protein [Hoeflea ulvae]